MTARAERRPPETARHRGRSGTQTALIPRSLIPIFRTKLGWTEQLIPADLTDPAVCAALTVAQRREIDSRILQRLKFLSDQGKLPNEPLRLLMPASLARVSRGWPAGLRVAFDRAELAIYSGRTIELTVRDLAWAVGQPRSHLLQLLRLLEAHCPPAPTTRQPGRTSHGGVRARKVPLNLQDAFATMRRIEDMPDLAFIHRSDPRFVRYWPAFAQLAETVEELVGLVATCNSPEMMPAADRIHLMACQRLFARIEGAAKATVAEELADLAEEVATAIDPASARRNAAGFLEHYSRSNSPPIPGFRRARSKMEAALQGTPVWTPALANMVSAARGMAPMSLPDVENELRGLLGRGQSLGPALALARLLGEDPAVQIFPAELSTPMLVGAAGAHLFHAVRRASRRRVFAYGAARVEDVRDAVLARWPGGLLPTSQVVSLLARLPGFAWLDKTNTWFWFGAGNASAPIRRSLKLLAAGGKPMRLVSVLATLDASRRAAVTGFDPNRSRPPTAVFETMFQRSGFTAEGATGLLKLPRDTARASVLSSVEADLVRLITSRGGAAPFASIIRSATATGRMSAALAARSLQRSIVFESPANGVWAIRGRPLPPKRVSMARAAAQREAICAPG